MATRQEQKEKRRGEILMAALDLFIRKGYSATKIKDIADEVPMSVGLLFHYFESKECLYNELIGLGVTGPRQMLSAIEVGDTVTFFERCAAQTLQYAKTSEFTAKMFLLMSTAFYSEGIPETARALAQDINFYAETAPMIALGQRQGTIRAGDALSLSTTFWAALQGAIQAYALNKTLKLPEPEWIVDIIREKGRDER